MQSITVSHLVFIKFHFKSMLLGAPGSSIWVVMFLLPKHEWTCSFGPAGLTCIWYNSKLNTVAQFNLWHWHQRWHHSSSNYIRDIMPKNISACVWRPCNTVLARGRFEYPLVNPTLMDRLLDKFNAHSGDHIILIICHFQSSCIALKEEMKSSSARKRCW